MIDYDDWGVDGGDAAGGSDHAGGSDDGTPTVQGSLLDPKTFPAGSTWLFDCRMRLPANQPFTRILGRAIK
jgi:hypothetical protein